MADSLRAARGQPVRGNPRTSSQRSSALYDEQYLQPNSSYAARHSLRSVESRFSLNEHFAATRREFEFGFDDASSILERATLMSVGGNDDTLRLDGLGPESGVSAEDQLFLDLLRRNYHELLCITRAQSASPEQVRRAYFRLFRLLKTEKLSGQSRVLANTYFAVVQEAFETLIEPSRRLQYELRLQDTEVDDALSDVSNDPNAANLSNTDAACQLLQWQQAEFAPGSDIGVRFDGSKALHHAQRRQGVKGMLDPLDFSVSQSMSVLLPRLGQVSERLLQSAQGNLGRTKSHHAIPIRCGVPLFSVTASTYGIMRDLASIPPMLLADRYQPLLPEIVSRDRLPQLTASRPSPLVAARYRQEIFWRPTSADQHVHSLGGPRLPDTVIEIESGLLPEPSLTTRISNVLPVEGAEEPIYTELMVSKPIRPTPLKAPRLGLAFHRRLGEGNAFLCADSGDWALRPTEETCRFFDEFSKFGGKMPLNDIPLRVAPTVEVGYNFSSRQIGLQTGQALTRSADRGLKGLDRDIDFATGGGSWTVSAATSSSSAAGYLRYGCELDLPFLPSSSTSQPLHLEAELCTSDPLLSGGYLAVRALKRIGLLSKLGLEVGVTPYNLQVSLYWSRSNQRLKLPLLLANSSTTPRLFSARTLFWASVVPFATLAAVDFVSRRWPSRPRGSKTRRLADLSREQLSELVSRRRAEADELTALLAVAVEPRQAVERARGGLVVLSAKYGVKEGDAWVADEEVADVTVAVAALVTAADEDESFNDAGADGGAGTPQLLIPAGLRKSKILGFWDPAPLRNKVLLVRYLWRGREDVVEVKGREELKLP
ncbi:uncharacterized protein E0L32_003323 [Thyridium curvatum]|uniref:J domain-containing protein n=1 Tax=Thyridium curvatum TaxID=1093900 RepID=A0A507B258_9PEZI|nr:uncharacterized protein E0L32_003323 [Thyridium curvatum]TPX17205.1 hypothetical protein E0L32_003323 [Thyridium curvatum]